MTIALYIPLRGGRIVYPPDGHAGALLQGATDVPSALQHIRYTSMVVLGGCTGYLYWVLVLGACKYVVDSVLYVGCTTNDVEKSV